MLSLAPNFVNAFAARPLDVSYPSNTSIPEEIYSGVHLNSEIYCSNSTFPFPFFPGAPGIQPQTGQWVTMTIAKMKPFSKHFIEACMFQSEIYDPRATQGEVSCFQ